jgi:hypothetical protein
VKDNIKLIYCFLLMVSFVFLVLIAVIFLENEAQKTQLGLAIIYFIGVLVFLHNIYAFYRKKVMRLRSLTFYHPQDNLIRAFVFVVSIIAVGGFGFAFFSSLLKFL